MGKIYYYIKVSDEFFKQKEMKKLRKIAGGDTYTIIYLKMLLLAAKQNNKLYFDGIEDNFAEEMAIELDEDPDNVKMTLSFLQKYKLIQIISQDEYELTRCNEVVGHLSDEALRQRRCRERKKQAKLLECDNVTKVSPYIEIDIEKDIYIEKEKKIELDIERKVDNKSKDNEIAERIWKIYPKKVGKAKAMKKIPKIVKEIGEDKLIRAINSYKQTIKGKDIQYVLQGDTFFNGRYIDYLDVNIKENNYNTFNYKPKIEKVDNVEEMF